MQKKYNLGVGIQIPIGYTGHVFDLVLFEKQGQKSG